MRYLLDVNVLIALAFPHHASHVAAHAWFRQEPNRQWATCPLTQAGFVRIASRLLAGVTDGPRKALAALETDCRTSSHQYWPVDIDLRDLSDSQRSRLTGPNQIADMQLLLVAHRHRGQLATFDAGLKELAAGTRYSNSLLVL